MVFDDIRTKVSEARRYWGRNPNLDIILNDLKELIFRLTLKKIKEIYKTKPSSFLEKKKLGFYTINFINFLYDEFSNSWYIDKFNTYVLLSFLHERGYITFVNDSNGFYFIVEDKLIKEFVEKYNIQDIDNYV
ncbi:MAG: hypothetical protein QXL82_03155 [Candidatus Aenigmatarchaeota archaeon]